MIVKGKSIIGLRGKRETRETDAVERWERRRRRGVKKGTEGKAAMREARRGKQGSVVKEGGRQDVNDGYKAIANVIKRDKIAQTLYTMK